MGTLSCCRATERKLNFSVSRSAYVMPVKASARFALPRRNFIFSPPLSLFLSLLLSLSLSVLAAFPCVPGWTLLPWKRSRETVQDVAGAQTRRTLFVRWEKEVGMDEILFWLDADCHFRFELKRQKSHRASTKGWVRVGLQLLWAVCSQLKYIKGIILDLLMLASLYLICNFKGNRREKKTWLSRNVAALCSLKIKSCVPEITWLKFPVCCNLTGHVDWFWRQFNKLTFMSGRRQQRCKSEHFL